MIPTYTTCSIPLHLPVSSPTTLVSPEWTFSHCTSECGHHKLEDYKDGRDIKSQFETNWNPQFVSAHPGNVFGELWLFLFGDLPPGFSSITTPSHSGSMILFLHQVFQPAWRGIYCPQRNSPREWEGYSRCKLCWEGWNLMRFRTNQLFELVGSSDNSISLLSEDPNCLY